jgi:membrane protease YdiL (CAAX protease family)
VTDAHGAHVDDVDDVEYQQTHRWGLGEVAWGLGGALLASSIAFVIAAGIGGYKKATDVPLWVTVVAQIPFWAALLLAVFYAGERKGTGVVADFDARMKWRDIPIGIAVGVAGQVIVVPLVYWPIFKLFGNQDVSSAARDLTDRAHGGVDVVMLVLFVTVGAPIVEELFFRGLTQHALLKQRRLARVNPVAALVLSAVIFAAAHFEPLQFPGLLAFGLVLAFMAWRTQRLGPGIWAHLAFNAVTVAALLSTWHLPGQ